MIRVISFFLIGISSICCSSQEKENFEYCSFRKQLTPSGEYVIYKYARNGSMAYSSDVTGTELFKVNEPFTERKGEPIRGLISEWISNDTLLVYNFSSGSEQPQDTLSMKTEYENIGDFVVKSVFYSPNSFSSYTSEFDSVSTTRDSIIIRTVSKKGEKKFISFPLGGTTVQATSDSIIHIEISARLHMSMDFVYKNPDGTFTRNLPEVGTTVYGLTPTKKISPFLIQKKKVFWEQIKQGSCSNAKL